MVVAVPPWPAVLALHLSFWDTSLLFRSSNAVALLAWLKAGRP